jgi:thiamine transport system substrate-binding protein
MRKTPGLFLVLAAVLAACASPTGRTPAEPQTLTVLTHDSFAVTDALVKQFEQENNARVSFVKGGDAGAALNQAILTKDAPIADVFYGVDNTFLSRALDEGIFDPYDAPALEQIPAEYKLDPENNALPVDFGDVCLNYDKGYFASRNLAVPQSLQDLTKPEYKGLLVTEDPSTSSTGLAFLLATVSDFGENGYQSYWKSLKDNGVVVVDSWDTAYYTNFSGSSGHGPQPLVVSYNTSPAAEVVFANPPVTESPTASITAPGTCFRQIEFVGILKGARDRPLAEKFVDFMLSKPFQEDMPLQMFVYPVLTGAQLPQVFDTAISVPAQPVTMAPQDIADHRDDWIKGWNSVMNP